MTGIIDKGDVIIYEEYKDQKINENQVVIFKSEKMVIIHRVVEIKNVDDETRYYTKGDANQKRDEGYITDSDIIGIYKFKIKKIGELTLAFNKLFEK